VQDQAGQGAADAGDRVDPLITNRQLVEARRLGSGDDVVGIPVTSSPIARSSSYDLDESRSWSRLWSERSEV
jgi:hypothetical protein